MKRRRLYKYHPAVEHQPVFEIEQRQGNEDVVDAFRKGIECGARMAEAEMQRRHSLQQSSLARVRQDSFDMGYRAANIQPLTEGTPRASYTYQDISRAKAQGVEEGRRSKESEIRKGMIDKMVEECRVIAESNPSMAPAAKAIRHRIKKIF